jgi:hypothetical protein
MYLREAAKIPTRYDAYRNATKTPLTVAEVYDVMERFPCEVCGRTDFDFPNGKREQAIRGHLMWPDGKSYYGVFNAPDGLIDTFRDCVWLCPDHTSQRKKLLLSEKFDENFYRLMRSLYS